jgi:hypothetical protein
MQHKPFGSTIDLESTFLEIVLENQNLENQDTPCEWETCKKPAEFWLICPACSAREVQCEEHSLMIRKAPLGETVVFDRSCYHQVQQCECLTEPIKKI